MFYAILIVLLAWFSPSVYAKKNQCLNSVTTSLSTMSGKQPRKITIKVDKVIDSVKYTNRLVNKLGFNNHFQGVVVRKDTIYISGSNYFEGKGQLFVGKKEGNSFRLEKEVIIDGSPHLWHAGGLGVYKEKLLVPNENFLKDKSLLATVNADDLKTVTTIKRDENDAGAMAAIDVNNKGIIAVATPEQVDFYNYNDDDFKKMSSIRGHYYHGSNVALLKQCDGQIFYVDIYNDGSLGPWFADKDVVDLYRLENIDSTKPILTKIKTFNFQCHQDCNFSAGASITWDQGELKVYSVRHFHENGELEMNVFADKEIKAIAADSL